MPSVTWPQTTREAREAHRRVGRARVVRRRGEWERAVRRRREVRVVTACHHQIARER